MRRDHFDAGHQKPEMRSAFDVLRETEGPSDEELSAIESGSETAGNYYTPERINEFRELGASVDPAYAKVRKARSTGVGEAESRFNEPDLGLGRSSGNVDLPSSKMADARAQMDLAGIGLEDVAKEVSKTGEVSAAAGAATAAYDDEATEARSRAYPASTGFMEGEERVRQSPFTRARQSPDVGRRQRAGAGALMLREAGRCDSPGCQLLRATGMALTGQMNRLAGSGAESNVPAIPSRPATAAERKTGGDVRPLDPKNPEYVALQKESQGASNSLFFPEDALAHNHADEAAHLAYVQQRISGLLKGQGEYND